MSDKHSAIFGKAKDEYEAGRWSKAMLRILVQRSRFGSFAYYCWGAGLVTLILSLVA